MAVGKHEEALALYDAALAAGPSEAVLPQLRAGKALALRAAGRLEEALDTYGEAFDELERLRQDGGRKAAMALDVVHRTTMLQQEKAVQEERVDALEAALQDLQEATRRIHEMSIRDSLTGLHNRQYLLEHGPALVRGSRPDAPAQVALIDLDRFKEINDTLGHAAGDTVLRAFAALLAARLAPDDMVARYGGEEFVVVRGPSAPGITPRPLRDDLERVLEEGRRLQPLGEGTLLGGGVRMSVGLTTLSSTDLPGALSLADQRMYVAKRAGGDGICER